MLKKTILLFVPALLLTSCFSFDTKKGVEKYLNQFVDIVFDDESEILYEGEGSAWDRLSYYSVTNLCEADQEKVTKFSNNNKEDFKKQFIFNRPGLFDGSNEGIEVPDFEKDFTYYHYYIKCGQSEYMTDMLYSLESHLLYTSTISCFFYNEVWLEEQKHDYSGDYYLDEIRGYSGQDIPYVKAICDSCYSFGRSHKTFHVGVFDIGEGFEDFSNRFSQGKNGVLETVFSRYQDAVSKDENYILLDLDSSYSYLVGEYLYDYLEIGWKMYYYFAIQNGKFFAMVIKDSERDRFI